MDSQFSKIAGQPFRVALIADEVAVTGGGVALLLTPEAAANLARGLLEVVTKVARSEPRTFYAEVREHQEPPSSGAGSVLRRFD